jgi:hypothetical protein
MTNKKANLRYYVKLDKSGRAVTGSGVWKAQAPTEGKWVDVTPLVDCCAATRVAIPT